MKSLYYPAVSFDTVSTPGMLGEIKLRKTITLACDCDMNTDSCLIAPNSATVRTAIRQHGRADGDRERESLGENAHQGDMGVNPALCCVHIGRED